MNQGVVLFDQSTPSGDAESREETRREDDFKMFLFFKRSRDTTIGFIWAVHVYLLDLLTLLKASVTIL